MNYYEKQAYEERHQHPKEKQDSNRDSGRQQPDSNHPEGTVGNNRIKESDPDDSCY